MSLMWMPAQTTVPPGASASRARTTSSPAEAKTIAASRGTGGRPPAPSAPHAPPPRRGEDDRRLEGHRWPLAGASGPHRATLAGEGLASCIAVPGEGVELHALGDDHLGQA